MTDVVTPPCDADQAPLPPRGTRVRHVSGQMVGVVTSIRPANGHVCVLWDGGMFADWYRGVDVRPEPGPEADGYWDDDPDEDDGFAEHDADDAIKDARREEARS